MKNLLAILLVASVGGAALAGPFFFRHGRQCWTTTKAVNFPMMDSTGPYLHQLNSGNLGACLTSSTRRADFKGAEHPVAEQFSDATQTVQSTSPAPVIAGEKRPDAGLPSLIGRLLPSGKIEFELPDLSKMQLPPLKIEMPSLADVDLSKIDLSKAKLPRVDISGALKTETLESFDSLAQRLHTLATFIMAATGASVVGTVGPWVARLVSGLQRFFADVSRLRQAASSNQPIQSLPAIPAAQSTTGKPAT